jgi:hypothetical protein
MKKYFKSTFKIVVVLFLFIFISCEKDLYNNEIVEQSQSDNPKINYVTIEQVPFLIPKIQEFNHSYDYLSSRAILSSKETVNLNLDLDKILEYVYANGMKSYSIIIKQVFQDSEDKYFENLHIYEKDGEYKSLIFKYNSIDDSKEFKLETFTGRVEIFDIDYNLVGIIDYENGSKICIKIVIGCLHIWDFGHGDIWIWGSIDCSDSANEGSSSGGGGGGSGANSGGGSSGGSGGGSGGGGGAIGLYPNSPSLYEQFVLNLAPYTNNFKSLDPSVQEIIANYITNHSNHFIASPLKNFLLSIFTNMQVNNWFINTTVENQISIFEYASNNNFSSVNSNFINQCILQMINNPNAFNSITPFFIEKQIDDSSLDPCTQDVLNNLKNLQQNDIAKIFDKLNNQNIVVKPFYSTKIIIEDPINSTDALAQTNWITIPNSNELQPGSPVQSPFNYIIRIRPSYLDGTMLSNVYPPNKPTKLSIARTLLHEIIHAYFDSLFDDCYYNNNCAEIKEFPVLWNEYLILKNGGIYPDDSQHLTIANSFVKILASALQEFNTGIPVSDNVEPDQDYIDLAWKGLEGDMFNLNNSLTHVFNLEYPLGSLKRIRYDQINAAEDLQQLAPQIAPKSLPCN